MNSSCYRLTRKGFSSFFLGLMAICVGLSLIATPASAQATSSSTVAGLVTDQQNAVIVGADVRLIDATTNSTRTTTTNEAGRYIFINIEPGFYNITVSKAGFTQAKVTGQKVDLGAALTMNVALQLGATSTIVEVTAAAGAELQTTNAAVGTTIDKIGLEMLPNLGRDASTLAVLQPGTTSAGYVAGVFRDQNTFQLDGGNASSDMDGTQTTYTTAFSSGNGNPTGALPVPVESIEEFKVTTFNQTSDFNGSAGSQIQMATKRGTNQFHGSAYEYYFATNVGAANSWKNNHTLINGQATPLPSNHRNRFGGTLGGQLIPKNFLGGKTYFFVNYEGFRFPNVSNFEHIVPSDLLRLGVVQLPDASGKYQPYNLNPFNVTGPDGTVYKPAVCPAGNCDPRGVGLNPIVNQIWNLIPHANDTQNFGDHFNTQGYNSTLRAPQRSNSYVIRIDHDFSEKWRFMASYRYTKYVELNTAQVDLSGGQPHATSPRDQLPGYFVTGLNTTINPTTTNSFRFNYTRNFWQWGSLGARPQITGLGAALEIGGESATNNLTPINVNTQSVRRRYWDGIDKVYSDDLTMIKGNHLFQFGGTYQRNFDSHQRDDNGQTAFADPTYISTNQGVVFPSAYIPAGIPAGQITAANTGYTNLYAEVLGIVSLPQVVYVRGGPALTLQPQGSFATDHSVVPSYSVYFSDTWHMKPSFTLTYGLGWLLEMPPYEINGKQVVLVDANGNPIEAVDYLAQRQKAALAGQVYQPTIGFETVRNVGSGLKYPFNPYYGGFSPRVSAAWSPKYGDGLLGKMFGNGKTVLRGGYGRIYGRLNGVALLLVPLLAPGPLQAVSCPGASSGGQCLGSGVVDPTNAFRIGKDGLVAPLPAVSQSFPQPFYPGVGGNATAGDGSVLDPRYKPNRTDNFTLSIQRELSSKTMLEIGYLGRILKNEFQEFGLDSVPTMTTLNGQTFAQAYANVFSAIPATGTVAANANLSAQAFFESAMGGANSAYCTGYSNCTTAVASKNTTFFRNTAVSDLWKALNNAPSWTLGRTMISGSPTQALSAGMYGPFGHGNYNAVFATVRLRDWHGVTAVSNFTWGRALGTGDIAQSTSSSTVLNPFNINASYGPQSFDIKYIYNLSMYYQPPYFKSQRGVLGHLLGGWTIAPLFTAQSGVPIVVNYSEGSCTGCQAFGEATPPASVSPTNENAAGAAPYTGGTKATYNNFGSTTPGGVGVGTNNPSGVNMFANPAAVFAEFRPCVLGLDTSCGSTGALRGLSAWNLDATVAKNVNIFRERISASLVFQFTNVLNHMQASNPTLSLSSPQTFGTITSQANSPRSMEFGLRIKF